MFRYKYNKYNTKIEALLFSKMMKILNKTNQIGGGKSFGCCEMNCERNPRQIKFGENKRIQMICCDLCLSSEGKNHTKKCLDLLSDDICNCGRVVLCGIDLTKGDKNKVCCELCETGTHTKECDLRQQNFTKELQNNEHKTFPLDADEKQQNSQNSGKEQPPIKKVLGEINAKMKQKLDEAISDLDKIMMSYKTDKLEQIISRALFESVNNPDKKMAMIGFNFFNKYFLQIKLPITEQIAVNGLKLMAIVNVPVQLMLEFIENLSSEIKIGRRLYSEIFRYCQNNKLGDIALGLLRFAIINKIIFTKEDVGFILGSIVGSIEETNEISKEKYKNEIVEIINYIMTQDYFEEDTTVISPLGERSICSIFECKKSILHPYFTQNTIQKIKQNENTILEKKHLIECKLCSKSLNRYNFNKTEKKIILDSVIKKLGDFVQIIDDKLKDINIDYVIDGANVGYQFEEQGKKVTMKFRKINMIVQKLNGNIAIFLHQQHIDKAKKRKTTDGIENMIILESWQKMTNVKLVITPYNENDDFSWIYTTIKYEAMLISNDNMNDHYDKIFKSVWPIKFRLWQKLHQINHQMQSGDVMELSLPPVCLRKIQKVENTYFFPLEGNEWLCVDV